MDKDGILSDEEKQTVTEHLRTVGLRNCTHCTGSTSLELMDQVVTMRIAELSMEHETYLVAVKCKKCKALRFYPAKELGVARSTD